jgi:hypothetical protein
VSIFKLPLGSGRLGIRPGNERIAIRQQIRQSQEHVASSLLTNSQMEAFGRPLVLLQRSIFDRECLGSVRAFPAARNLLTRLHRSGTWIVLVTWGTFRELSWYEGVAGISDLVAGRITAEDVEAGATSEHVVRLAECRIGSLPAKEMIWIGLAQQTLWRRWDCEFRHLALLQGLAMLPSSWLQDIRQFTPIYPSCWVRLDRTARAD